MFGGLASEGEGIPPGEEDGVPLPADREALADNSPVWQSGCKYLGYRLGKAYRSLPRWLVLRCTMNRAYWEKEEQEA